MSINVRTRGISGTTVCRMESVSTFPFPLQLQFLQRSQSRFRIKISNLGLEGA